MNAVSTSASHSSVAVITLATKAELDDISGKTCETIIGMFNFEPNKRLGGAGTDVFRFMQREGGNIGGMTVHIFPDVDHGEKDEDFGEYFTNKLLPVLMHLAGMVSGQSDEETVKFVGAEIFDRLEILCNEKRKKVAEISGKPITEVLLPASSFDGIIPDLIQQLVSSGNEDKIKLGFLLFALNQGPAFDLPGRIIGLWIQMGGESAPMRNDSLKVKIDTAKDGTLSYVSTSNVRIDREKTDPRFIIATKTTVTLSTEETTDGVEPHLEVQNEVEIHLKKGSAPDQDIVNFMKDLKLAGLEFKVIVDL